MSLRSCIIENVLVYYVFLQSGFPCTHCSLWKSTMHCSSTGSPFSISHYEWKSQNFLETFHVHFFYPLERPPLMHCFLIDVRGYAWSIIYHWIWIHTEYLGRKKKKKERKTKSFGVLGPCHCYPLPVTINGISLFFLEEREVERRLNYPCSLPWERWYSIIEICFEFYNILVQWSAKKIVLEGYLVVFLSNSHTIAMGKNIPQLFFFNSAFSCFFVRKYKESWQGLGYFDTYVGCNHITRLSSC